MTLFNNYSKPALWVIAALLLSACDQIPNDDCKEKNCDIPISGDAWIGKDNTLVYPNTEQSDIELLSFSNADCDIKNLGICQNAQSQTINGRNPLTVNALTLSQPGYFKLQSRNRLTDTFELSTQSIDINTRYNIASFNDIVSFKGKLWTLQRFDSPQNPLNPTTQTIWSSDDGLNWDKNETNQALPNMLHKILVFNDQLWMIASVEPNKYEILSSNNGTDWATLSHNLNLDQAMGLEFAVFKNKLWAVGTQLKTIQKEIREPGLVTVYFSDVFTSYVWSSENGTTWKEEARNINPFKGAFLEHRLTAFNGELWLTGSQYKKRKQKVGNSYHTYDSNVIWHSEDGKTWQPASTPGIKPRVGHQTITFDNKLWLIGGFMPGTHQSKDSNEVWVSNNGLNWEKASEGPFSPRAMHRAFVFNDHLWVSGDGSSFGVGKHDLWRTKDGMNWRLGVNLSAAKKIND